jgi:PAS domain S-box-containing protein
MRITLPVTDVEHRVPKNAVLVSRTNLKGIINYCNLAFCAISGYTEGELLGKPHNIIRHPDVPSEYFADCWQCIESDFPWNGIVKNRCKNGDYYWVEVNVTPWFEHGEKVGYVSLRYRATRAQIATAEKNYLAARQNLWVAEFPVKPDLHYIVELQQRLADKIMALEKHRDRSDEELQIGSDIMARINGMHGMTDPSLRQKISPAAYYSGDMILTTRISADVLHVLLADAVGHGLTAAINVLPLSQTFHSMSKKGFNISRIAEELNQKIHKFMPVDRFVSTTLISIDSRNQKIEVWNGGNPPAVLLAEDGEILYKWKSRNLPLGIFDSDSFSSATEIFDFKHDCQLYLFSDGLPEAESPNGEAFGYARIDALLQTSSAAQRFDDLIGEFEAHLGGQAAHDDVSLAMVSISPRADSLVPDSPLNEAQWIVPESGWRFALSLGSDQLKQLKVIPLLRDIICKINADYEHQSALFLILSELLNNALDHGVLQLDSRTKQGADGFEAYLELRAARLRELKNGKIDLEIEKIVVDGKDGLKIRIVDSGDGFDYEEFQTDALSQHNQAQHGRGLAIVSKLAYKLTYAQRGSDVVAYYIFS